MSVGLADDIALNLHVHHDEICAIERVGHDTTDECGSKDHCIGAFFVEESLDGNLVGEIQFLMTASDQIGITALQQVIPNSGTHKSVVSRYINFAILV